MSKEMNFMYFFFWEVVIIVFGIVNHIRWKKRGMDMNHIKYVMWPIVIGWTIVSTVVLIRLY